MFSGWLAATILLFIIDLPSLVVGKSRAFLLSFGIQLSVVHHVKRWKLVVLPYIVYIERVSFCYTSIIEIWEFDNEFTLGRNSFMIRFGRYLVYGIRLTISYVGFLACGTYDHLILSHDWTLSLRILFSDTHLLSNLNQLFFLIIDFGSKIMNMIMNTYLFYIYLELYYSGTWFKSFIKLDKFCVLIYLGLLSFRSSSNLYWAQLSMF